MNVVDDFIRPEKPQVTKKKKHLRKEIVVLVGIIFSLLVGIFIGYIIRSPEVRNVYSDDAIIDEVYDIIDTYWYNPSDKKIDIQDTSIKGLLAGLQDPYTTFMTKEEAEAMMNSINGDIEGIGVSFVKIPEGIGIIDVYDGPAKKSGIQSGDRVIKVNQEDLKGKTTDEVRALVSGSAGTKVELEIKRGNETLIKTMNRGNVATDLSYEIRKNNQIKFGYIKITTFGENTASQMEEALKQFQENKINTLVLDVRSNTGGYLNAAKDILDLFIEADEVMYKMKEKTGPTQETVATARTKYNFMNNYILVNSESASASEIVAGSLQEVKGFQLVGNTTFGKGIAQTQAQLSNGAILKYTYAKWMMPSGTCIHEKGLTPDIEVKDEAYYSTGIEEIAENYEYDQVDPKIAQMQVILKMLGYEIDRIDGYFSNTTKESLMKFESEHNVTVNGVYEHDDGLLLNFYARLYLVDETKDQQYHKLLQIME